MKLKLTRRQFGQLMIGSTAMAGLGYFGQKTSAQTPSAQTSTILYGARLDRKAGGYVIQSLDLATKKIQDITTVSIESGQRLNDFSYAGSNTFVLNIGPTKSSKTENSSSRLLSLTVGQTPTSTSISGLTNEQNLKSILVTSDGSLMGLVQKNDKTSSELVNINRNTAVLERVNNILLSVTERFSNLAQARLDNLVESRGIVYTTNLALQGDTSLVELDSTRGQVGQGVQLKLNGTAWNSGFASLASGPGDLVYALGNERYKTPYNLYTVNVRTGEMTLLQAWDVALITSSLSG
ncbi:hypothetical protein [Brasilonema sp. UFV-L1]|uniref:hypothetical protein n=1 Tax=Brasilonema sp. UFV-L1 TaxID=2234130 RepID=UPI00145E0CAE|nr:hypothetical protein [Brasilonema sp. UFV-L1]NMG10417.1 hypothetical protein [Brasilonema sp. UFV-L1]